MRTGWRGHNAEEAETYLRIPPLLHHPVIHLPQIKRHLLLLHQFRYGSFQLVRWEARVARVGGDLLGQWHQQERDVGSGQGGAEAVGRGLDGALERRCHDDGDLVGVREGAAQLAALLVAEGCEGRVAEVMAALTRVSGGGGECYGAGSRDPQRGDLIERLYWHRVFWEDSRYESRQTDEKKATYVDIMLALGMPD